MVKNSRCLCQFYNLHAHLQNIFNISIFTGNQSRGPQIIVLGGNSSMPVQNPTNSTPAAGAASAPPILILAGGGGDNNNAQSQGKKLAIFLEDFCLLLYKNKEMRYDCL